MRYAQLVDVPYNARLTLTTAAAAAAVSLTEIKQHVRVDHADDDDYLVSLVTASRHWIEQYLGRQLVTATWTMFMDRFPPDDVIELPRPPLLTVSSIKYYDTGRALQTLDAASYHTHLHTGPEARMGRVELAVGYWWPTTYEGEGSVQIAYTAGYGATGVSVPLQIRQAIMLHAAELYERREQVITGTISTPAAITVERLLWPLRVY